MAADQIDPVNGHPIFLDSGAPQDGPDLTTVAEYAADVGTRIIRDSYDELQAYKWPRVGLQGVALDTGVEFRYTATGWAPVGVTPWVNLILLTGWTPVAGHTPRVRHVPNAFQVEGAAFRNAGGNLAAVAQFPNGFIPVPGKSSFYGSTVAIKGGTSVAPASTALWISGGGVLHLDTYGNIDSSAGWTIPVSGFIADSL